MPTIRVRDLDMYFETHGRPDGEPLVLLHGFTSTGRMFDSLLEPLGARYRLIVPDWRGHGRTKNPKGQIAHAELARDAAALADALGIARAHFCGYSSGGMQLPFLALEHPGLVHSLTLMAASYTLDDHAQARVREVIASASPQLLQNLDATHGETQGTGYGRTLMRLWADTALRPGELPFTPADLEDIACPTLIVHGDRDQFFPVRIPVTMYQAIPHAELCIVPNSTHGMLWENTALCTAVLLGFLERHPFAGPGG
jgi:pimeloyl-ACP methyl ester carboxylesterase